jgi:hypothetical protein
MRPVVDLTSMARCSDPAALVRVQRHHSAAAAEVMDNRPPTARSVLLDGQCHSV